MIVKENTMTELRDRILYEDNHLIVVNKMPSEIVQGDKTGDIPLSETVKDYLAQKYQKHGNVFLGVAHRIDRPTSGAVVFARTSKALARLNAMFAARQLTKKYWVVAKWKHSEAKGRLEHFLLKNESKNKSFVVSENVFGAKKAELLYKVIATSQSYVLLEVELLTGRHHQIRAQFAELGCPIKGDLKYGADRSNPDGSIHLHARQIAFAHPVGNHAIEIVAPVPDESLWMFFEGKFK